MNSKIVVFFALMAVAYAAPGGLLAAAPAIYSVPTIAAAPALVASNSREIYRSQDALGASIAGYSVVDGLTGDIKASHEERIPGAAVGTVSQLDPNGYIRTTDYVSDAFGTRQVITGSENGLYVNAKDHVIRPYAVARKKPRKPVPAVVSSTISETAPFIATAPAIAAVPALVIASVAPKPPGVQTYAAVPRLAAHGILASDLNAFVSGGLLTPNINTYAAGLTTLTAGGLLTPGLTRQIIV